MDLPRLSQPAPSFKEKAVLDNKVFDLSLSDYMGKYVILLFYPMNFAYVCPTELISFSEQVDNFAKLNTSIIACATESHFSHLKWLSMAHTEGGIHGLRIPLIADKTMSITKKYGVLNEDEGIAYRATFIIDDKGILRQLTINDRLVGRSVAEARRLIRTIQHAEKLRADLPVGGFVEVSPSSVSKARIRMSLERNLRRELTE